VQYVKGGELLIYHEYLEHDGTPKTAPSEFRLVDVHEQISADWDFVATVRRFGDGRAVWFLYLNTRIVAVPTDYELLPDTLLFRVYPYVRSEGSLNSGVCLSVIRLRLLARRKRIAHVRKTNILESV
jgi:hypothetical protein